MSERWLKATFTDDEYNLGDQAGKYVYINMAQIQRMTVGELGTYLETPHHVFGPFSEKPEYFLLKNKLGLEEAWTGNIEVEKK